MAAVRGLMVCLLALAVFATDSGPAAAQSSPCDTDPITCMGSAPGAAVGVTFPPWTRSIICPVLYTHEVVSQVVMRRMLTALVAAGYRPTSLATVDAAMSGTADPPPGCLVLT